MRHEVTTAALKSLGKTFEDQIGLQVSNISAVGVHKTSERNSQKAREAL